MVRNFDAVATLKNISNPVWGISVIGYGVIVEGIAAIRQRMDIAIRTTKGTDPLRPEFGSHVFKFIDRKTTIAVPNIKTEILKALQLWVPEIKVISIRHSFPQDYSNPHFEVTYRLVDESLIDKLLFDIREGISSIPDQLSELILQAFIPENPNAYRYTLKLFRNGSQVFPMPNPSGFATIQELFDWAKTNLFYVGKWFLLSDKVVCYMKAEGVTSASMVIETLPVVLFQSDFPSLIPGEVYKVEFTANGEAATPRCPQIFTSPGDVLAWCQTNWANYAAWAIEFLQTSGEGVFSDEFSDEFQVDATGFRLVGISNTPGFVADLQITKIAANKFEAEFPQLVAGEFYKVEFKKDGVPVNPNVPTIYTNPGDVLSHAQTYWGSIADWGINQINSITGADVLSDEFSNEFDTQEFDYVLVGVGFTSFDAELTITKI